MSTNTVIYSIADILGKMVPLTGVLVSPPSIKNVICGQNVMYRLDSPTDGDKNAILAGQVGVNVFFDKSEAVQSAYNLATECQLQMRRLRRSTCASQVSLDQCYKSIDHQWLQLRGIELSAQIENIDKTLEHLDLLKDKLRRNLKSVQ